MRISIEYRRGTVNIYEERILNGENYPKVIFDVMKELYNKGYECLNIKRLDIDIGDKNA